MPKFSDLCTKLDDCCYRLAFLQDAFTQNIPGSMQPAFEMTEDGQNGLYAILGDIKGEIKEAGDMAEVIIHGEAGHVQANCRATGK